MIEVLKASNRKVNQCWIIPVIGVYDAFLGAEYNKYEAQTVNDHIIDYLGICIEQTTGSGDLRKWLLLTTTEL